MQVSYSLNVSVTKKKRIANEFERLTSADRKQQTGKTMRFLETFFRPFPLCKKKLFHLFLLLDRVIVCAWGSNN